MESHSASRPATRLIIPCYNEERRLDLDAFRSAIDANAWLSLCFVDDGSTDNTRHVLGRLVATLPRVEVTSLRRNQGKAAAVREGVLQSLAAGDRQPRAGTVAADPAATPKAESSLLGYWDADLAAPLEEAGPMVDELLAREAFMVLGSRVRLLGRTVERSMRRHYLGRIFATAASLAVSMPVYDTQCGAKIFRAGALARALFDAPFTSRWAFDVELLARLQLERRGPAACSDPIDVIEYPLERWRDVRGSRIGVVDGLRAFYDLGRIGLSRRNQRPRSH